MTRNIAQAERAFVGSLLRDSSQIDAVSNVAPDMLAEPHHRLIYQAMLRIVGLNKRVSTPALLAELPPEFEGQGPAAAVIAALRANAEDAGPAADYADLLLERHAQRKISEINGWTTEQVKRAERPVEDIAAEASRKLQDVMSLASPVRRVSLAEAAARAVDKAAAAAQSGIADAGAGIPTGIPALDAILGRLYGLSFLLASQNEGKSALAAQIAMSAAAAGRPVLFFQFEMDAEEMGAREIAARSGLTVAQIREAQSDVFDAEQIGTAISEIKSLPFWIVESDSMTVRQIGAQAKAMHRQTGLSLVVVDQLDKIAPEIQHRDDNSRISEVTRALKGLSKSMPDVTFLILGQRIRGAQRREDPTPEINDADGRGVERDADVVFAIWLPANWLRRQRPKRNVSEEMDKWEGEMRRLDGKAEAIILKHRRRKAFQQCELKFDGQRMRFEDSQ